MMVWKAKQRPEDCPPISFSLGDSAWCWAWLAGTQICKETSILLPRLVCLPVRASETGFPGDTRTAVQTGDEAAAQYPAASAEGQARPPPHPPTIPSRHGLSVSATGQRQGGRDSRRLREVSCEKHSVSHPQDPLGKQLPATAEVIQSSCWF